MWNYWPLRFATKSEADSFALPSSDVLSWDNIGILNDTPQWHVNIAVVGEVPESLQNYVIPFPLQPKRVFFRELEGGAL